MLAGTGGHLLAPRRQHELGVVPVAQPQKLGHLLAHGREHLFVLAHELEPCGPGALPQASLRADQVSRQLDEVLPFLALVLRERSQLPQRAGRHGQRARRGARARAEVAGLPRPGAVIQIRLVHVGADHLVAAALVAGGHAGNLQQAAIKAQEALDSGKALAALDNLIAITNDKA